MAIPGDSLFGVTPPSVEQIEGTVAGTPFLSSGMQLEQVQSEINAAPDFTQIQDDGTPLFGKPITFDVYGAYEAGYTLPQIAMQAILEHGAPAGTYAKLKETKTDDEIIQRLFSDPVGGGLYTLPSTGEALVSGGKRGLYYSGAMGALPGAAMAVGISNPLALIPLAIAGIGTGAYFENAVLPSERVMPDRRNTELGAEFVTSNLAFAPAPFVLREGAVANNLGKLIPEFARRAHPLFSRSGRAVDWTGKVIETGLRTGRKRPGAFLTTEGLATASGAGAGMLSGEGDVETGWGRMGVETLAAALNPFNAMLGVFGGTDAMSTTGAQLRARYSGTGRKNAVADKLIEVFDAFEEGNAQKVMQLLDDESELATLFKQEGIDFGNPTSAEKVGVPEVYALQNWQAKNDPILGERITDRAGDLNRQMQRLMHGLVFLDNKELLGAFDAARLNFYEGNLDAMVNRAYQQYEQSLDRLTRSGEVIDENTLLSNLLNETVTAAREQEKALYKLIPNDVPTRADNFLGAVNEVLGQYQVGGKEAIRIDTGQNPLSLRNIIEDLREITKNTDDATLKKLDDLARKQELERVRELTPEMEFAPATLADEGVVARTNVDAPEQPIKDIPTLRKERTLNETITSGDLMNIRDILLEGIRREGRGANGTDSMLGDAYARLEEAVVKDIAAIQSDQLPQGAAKQYLDNAVAFTDALNDTFKRTFLRTVETSRNVPPELLLQNVLLRGPAKAVVALTEMDQAVRMLKDSLVDGTLPNDPVRNQIMSGNFPTASNPQEQALLNDLTELGPRLQTMQTLQDDAIRAIFRKFSVEGPDGRLKPNQTQINNFLRDPNNIRLIEIISPPVSTIDNAGNEVRRSPLLGDLQDSSKASKLFVDTQQRVNKNLKDAHRQIPLVAFLTGANKPIVDNPGRAIANVLGSPGPNRPPNAETDFTEIVKNIAGITQRDLDGLSYQKRVQGEDGAITYETVRLGREYTVPDLKDALFQAVVNQGFVESGGFQAQGFNFANFDKYMNDPIIPGLRRGPIEDRMTLPKTEGKPGQSPLQIMRENKIIDDVEFMDFQTILDQALKSEEAIARGDIEAMTKMFNDSPITFELVQRIVGAKGGQALGELLPGQSNPSLIAGAAGSKALRQLMDAAPNAAFRNLWTDILSNPETMREYIKLGLDRKAKGIKGGDLTFDFADLPFAASSLRTLRALLIDAGAGTLPFVEDLFDLRQPEFGDAQPQQTVEEAAFERIREQQAQEQQTVAPPVAMTDQAQQFMPQVAPPVAQAPANPNTRAQFAAMYPNDITSDIIRTQQGIGSLLGNV